MTTSLKINLEIDTNVSTEEAEVLRSYIINAIQKSISSFKEDDGFYEIDNKKNISCHLLSSLDHK